MRNVEQIEYELTLLKDKSIILIIPMVGRVSMSILGDLQVVECDHKVGFHLSTTMPMAIIFYAEDVEAIEPSQGEGVRKVVRICQKA
jgi:hypothetical protein